jgi:hypothetical protein
VNVPIKGKVEPHTGDAPNHGVTIDLENPGDVAWTYAHWDAALLGSSQKAALDRLDILLEESPSGRANIAPTMLAGLSAYRIRLDYADKRPMSEDVVIAYRKAEKDSEGPGRVYEIGVKCRQATYPECAKVLDALVGTFQTTVESRTGALGK